MRTWLTLFLIIAAIVVGTSCAGTRNAMRTERKLNGNWMLETIATEGIEGKVKTQLFNEASFKCFVGSGWTFISSNNTGTYKINSNGSECASTNRAIRWTIETPKDSSQRFLFKRMGADNNVLDNGDGFGLEIISLTDNQMQLKSSISFEGRPAAYIYNFVKN